MPRLVWDERDLRFTFNVARLVRWDGHVAFRSGVGQVQTSRAADLCVVLNDGTAVVFEVTDYRGHRVAARRAVGSGQLVDETAEKVRDSLAGLIWAAFRPLGQEPWFDSLVGSFVNRRRSKLTVVLWVEGVDAAVASVLGVEIESRLSPAILAKVIVTNRALEAGSRHSLDWVEASGRPGGVRLPEP